MGAMGHTKTIEMKIPQENKKECLEFANTFEIITKHDRRTTKQKQKSECE